MVAGPDFDTLFRSQFERLVALGVAMSGSVEVARDLAQETMARAYSRWDSLAAVDVPEAWLRRVMTNLLIDHLRRGRVETAAIERLPRHSEASPDNSSGYRLADLLSVLPERQRAVVALYYVDDLPIAEISAALGIAQGTVKALLWKARRSLERHVTNQDRDGEHRDG